MSADFDGYLIEAPGVVRSLAWPANEEIERAASSALIADVFRTLSPLIRPLSMDIILRAYRRDPYEEVSLKHPFLFLASASTAKDPGVYPGYERAVCKLVDALTPDTIEAQINEAMLSEQLGPGVVWTWHDIRAYAVEVRVPNGLSQRDMLSLEVPMGDIGIEVKHRGDGAWVCGTDAPVDSRPFEVAMTGGFPALRLTTCWSLWMPGGPGESDLNAVIDALLARGWIRVSD